MSAEQHDLNTPTGDNAANSTNTEAQESSPNSWIQGFVDILTAPEELALRYVHYPMRVIVFAILMVAAAVTLTNYLWSINDGISAEMYTMQASAMEKMSEKMGLKESQIEEQLASIKQSLKFSPVRSLGLGVVAGSISIFFVGMLFWVLQRLFNAEPPPMLVIIALTAYGTSISFLGSIVSVLMQFAGNSQVVSPTLAFLARPVENHPLLFQFLLGLSVFVIAEYIVVGMVVARHVGMSRTQGMSIGATALVIRSLFVGGLPWLISQITGYGQ